NYPKQKGVATSLNLGEYAQHIFCRQNYPKQKGVATFDWTHILTQKKKSTKLPETEGCGNCMIAG
ncbi:MAG: hypothetical protein N3F63_07970, partial [Thermoplasmata archaeon]|nr:hypothetical protein [Thermoplasmata archaeon]